MSPTLAIREESVQAALAATDAMRHEFAIFMKAIAKWFDEHPELRTSTPPIVHSVKARLKDRDHLREKIERKWHDGDPISAENVFTRVTDLAGVRVLHLHQKQFLPIHEKILRKVDVQRDWVLTEPPRAYTWDPESDAFFRAAGLQCDLKDSFYTSVHYTIRPRPDSPLCCEVQVRTLFEEIWGEVDHALNYPHPTELTSCREQIKVLAKLVGAGSRLVDSIFAAASEPSVRETPPDAVE
jgi:putative GTP pyrophosphokinase